MRLASIAADVTVVTSPMPSVTSDASVTCVTDVTDGAAAVVIYGVLLAGA